MLGWLLLSHLCFICQSGSCRKVWILEDAYGIDHYKLKQVVALFTAAVQHAVSLLEQIYKASCFPGVQSSI